MATHDVSDFDDSLDGKISNQKMSVTARRDPSAPATEEEEEKPLNAAEKSLLQKVIRRGLVETTNDIEVQRKDPKSPLFSVKSFESLNLKPALLKGVYGMGFNNPSKIQEMALPALLADPPQNMIAQSQSGTGKTAAFVLAMLSRVDTSLNYPQVLCLSPTYELALQTGEVATKMSQFSPELTVRYAVRGEEIPRGSKITDHIIIGTPGKTMDWAIKFKFFDIKKVKVFVLDEADVMIAMQGHQDQSIRIQKSLSPDCQMLLFSATYDEDVMNFAENIISNPVLIRLRREEETLDNIKQYWVSCETLEAKHAAISNIYGVITIGQAMIFCQTRKGASWLAEKLVKEGHSVGMLSGELSIDERIRMLDRFRDGMEKILITTNVMARGIDVEQVSIVVNFDLPVDVAGKADCETYLHRIGRTGRFGKKGLAINLVDGPKSMAVLKDIEDHFSRPIIRLDTEDFDEIEKIQS
uniref:RNA helicase n=1 Tax=Lepeophtheirus salmonis TaxID=72036 RepID=A0A0K2T7Y8_LEPSM